MKKLILALSLIAFTAPAAANCDLIPDPDAKADCRAVTQGSPQQCDLIHNSDLKNNCRARFAVNPSNQCDLIHDHGLKERCRSRAKAGVY